MAVTLLLTEIRLELIKRGYKEVEPGEGGVWESPEGDVDHIIPMVIDCFERER